MRITTMQTFTRGIDQMQYVQREINKTYDQLSSGKRLTTPADDPVASARILQLNQELSQQERFTENIGRVTSRLELEDTQLGAVNNLLLRIRELTVQGGNGALSLSDRTSLATEIRVRMDELQGQLNSRDANGEYIFSGFKGSQIPFVEAPGGGFLYQGDSGQRLVQIATTTKVPAGDNGKDVFVDIPAAQNTVMTRANPNNQGQPPAVISTGQVVDQEAFDAFYPEDVLITFNDPSNVTPPGINYTITQKSDGRVLVNNTAYRPGDEITFSGVTVRVSGNPAPGDTFMVESSNRQDVLTTLARLADGLESFGDNEQGRTQLKTLLDDTLVNIDNAETNILEVRAQVGARLNTLDSTKALLEEVTIINKEVLSELEDIDYAEAVSRLSMQTFVLEAAQQSYTRVTRLSLFQYL